MLYSGVMLPFLLILAFLLQPQGGPKEIYKAPIDDTYNLRATVSYSDTAPRSRLRILLVDRTNANRYWEISSINEEYESNYTIRRADRSSVVVDRTSDYGIPEGSFKLFFDSASKRLLKQIEFNPIEALGMVRSEEAKRVGLDPVWFAQIQKADQLLQPSNENDQLPAAMKGQPLPQSTYAEFMRVRPAKAKASVGERPAIEEKIGPYQDVGDRIWFGKSFYDGEENTGVGAIGYFDKTQGKYIFLQIPEVVDSSISAILVEDGVVWAGMAMRPEGAAFSKGLLRYDLKTAKAQIIPLEDVIRSIHRSGEAMVMSTENSIYVLKEDGHLNRHRATPTMDGKFVLDTETLK